MTDYFRIQEVFLAADAQWKGFDALGLSQELTWPPVAKLVNFLYLFIPLLTMGMINREVNAGTIKLLYSSPVSIRHIVLGKYLGLLALIILLIVIVSIFLLSTTLIISNPDVNKQFAYALGIFLVANAYIAIGLFISCVTNYQIVAGVLTFVVFFILNSISALWQQYDLVRDITYFLSIAGRANYLLSGLISTRDIFYFLLITVMFLLFAMIKLKSTQESRPWTISFARYSVVFIIVLIIGYVSGRAGHVAYWDVSARKLNTISKTAQNVLKELDGSPLKITLYTNLLGANAVYGLPQQRNYYVWQVWEQYRRFYPNMEFEYVYFYDIYDDSSLVYKIHPKKTIHQIADKFAKEYGIRKSIFLKPDEIRKRIALGEESDRLLMQLEYKGKKTWLRTFKDSNVWPGQDNVAGAISRLTRDTVPKFLYTSGHFERNPYKSNERDYGDHVLSTYTRNSLKNLGMDADTISLKTSTIPAHTSALIVADPRKEMEKNEQETIKEYLQNGGNAMILGEMNKQYILNPVTDVIGIHLDAGTIVHPNAHEMPHILDAELTHAGGYLAEEGAMYSYQNKSSKEIKTKIEGGVNISCTPKNGFNFESLVEVKGNDKTWIENGILVVDSAAPTYSLNDRDVKLDKYTIGASIKRVVNNKTQRVIVSGDADMLTSSRNGAIGNSLYSWLLDNKYPFYANYPDPLDRHFNVGAITIKVLEAAYKYIIPALLLLFAIILLLRRKRK